MKTCVQKLESAREKEGSLMHLYSKLSFTFLSVKLSVKLIMDYSGEKRVGLLFVHKKRPDESD